MSPFRPNPASTFAVTAATGATPVHFGPIEGAGSGCQVRVRNLGGADAYLEFGGSTVTASAPVAGAAGVLGTPGSMGIAAGGVEIFTLQQMERYLAVAVASGSPSLEVTIGGGE